MSLAGRIVVFQALIGLVCSATFFALDDASGRSALLALVCSVVPSGYYAWVVGRTLHATRLLLHGVLRSLFTLTLMAVCITQASIEPLGFFVTFGVTQFSFLFSKRDSEA